MTEPLAQSRSTDTATVLESKNVLAWVGRGVSLAQLGRFQEAVAALNKAIDMNPQDALAHIIISELFLSLGNIDAAWDSVQTALAIRRDSGETWALRGRIEIEQRAYDSAIDSFKKAISVETGNASYLLWQAYACYLKAEFTLDAGSQRYEEQVLSIIRQLERAEKLCQEQMKSETRANILYFLGCFYHKTNDLIHARRRLRRCVKLDSSVRGCARELLENIWSYEVRPPLWRFWLASPLYAWPKRILSALLVLVIVALFLLHPFINSHLIVILFLHTLVIFEGAKVNWYIYGSLIGALILILVFPIIRRVKAKDIEVEVHAPPSVQPLFPPAMMAEMMGKLENWTRKDLIAPPVVE